MHKLFPSQTEDEKILLVVRQHWLILLAQIFVWGLFVLALILFNSFVPDWAPGLFEDTAGKITSLFVEVYKLFLILALFIIWMQYYLNIQVITDRRIVDVDQVGLFFHEVSELHIENIEDVTSDVSGIFGNLFDFGMVYVQTAGARERFEFNNVPNPGLINKLILDIYEQLPHHGGPHNHPHP